MPPGSVSQIVALRQAGGFSFLAVWHAIFNFLIFKVFVGFLFVCLFVFYVISTPKVGLELLYS